MNAVAHSPNGAIRETARRLGRDPDHQFRRRMPAAGDAVRDNGGEARPVFPALPRMLWKMALGLMVLTAGAVGVAQLVGDELARAGHSDDTTPHRVQVADVLLSVPRNYIRFGDERRSPALDRLDLYAHWPSLSGYSDELRDAFSGTGVDPSILFVTVEPRLMNHDMSTRAAALYSKFLVGEEIDTGNGLRKRQLSPKAGFVDEDLYYEAGAAVPFVTRCIRAGATGMAAFCIRDILVGESLTVTYRFHVSLIEDWRRLDAAIHGLVDTMRVKRSSDMDQSRSMSRIAMEKLYDNSPSSSSR